MGQYVRASHVRINGFATTIRDASNKGPGLELMTEAKSSQVLKMKVGDEKGENARSDALRVNELVALSGRPSDGGSWLRLDANQSWSIAQATVFADALSDSAIRAIEYVEEPLRVDCNDEAGYQQLITGGNGSTSSSHSSNWSRIPIALDETFCSRSIEESQSVLTAISSAVLSSTTTASPDHRKDNDDQSNIREVARATDTSKSRSGGDRVKQRCVIKPSLLSLSCSFLQGKKESSSSHTESTTPISVTISCTFESGIGLAYQVLIASFFAESFHGIHAKPDMIEVEKEVEKANEYHTGKFAALMRDFGGGCSGILVAEAEALIHGSLT
jgi:hypothetical protein